MSDRLHKFIALPAAQKGLLMQAWLMLGWYRLLLAVRPLMCIVDSLEQHTGRCRVPDAVPFQQAEARMVGKLVASAAVVTPWQSRCLVQVLVVQRLLARRDISGVVYIGACRDGELASAATAFSAHAWLVCGDAIVSGGAGHNDFTVLASFCWGETGRECHAVKSVSEHE
ncbi:MAG: lasso peptide biosynthesis B2 protein [Halioglobus sp.]